MGTSREEIEDWFKEGKKEKATHMIVVCDTFDYEDYPVYAHGDAECMEKYKANNNENMQRVMEVYDLRKDMKEQLNENRVFNLPKY